MPNPPIPLHRIVQLELTLGLLYGFAMVLVLFKPRGSSSMRWSLLVTVGGYLVLGLLQGTLMHGTLLQRATFDGVAGSASMLIGDGRVNGGWTSGWTSDWTLRHGWVLAVLVCLSRAWEDLCFRADRFVAGRLWFSIADLMSIATVFAVLVAGVRYTSLIERGLDFWLGMLVIASVVPLAVVGFRTDRGSVAWVPCGIVWVGAVLLVAALAWAETRIIQPGKIGLGEAATRYGWLIAAMMAPRLIEQSIALARRCGVTRWRPSVVDPYLRQTLDADCLETQSDAPHSFPMPRDDSRRTDRRATPQAQRGLSLIV